MRTAILFMYNSYIRPLSFQYKDAQEKEFTVEEVPIKFQKEKDNYQKRKPKLQQIESEEEI